MKTLIQSRRSAKVRLLVQAIFVCLLVVAVGLVTIPARADAAEDNAKKAFADWKDARKAAGEAKQKLADARQRLQNAMTAIALSGGKATDKQKEALAHGRDDVAAAEAALEAAEKNEQAARVALEKALAELPDDSKVKKDLQRQRDGETRTVVAPSSTDLSQQTQVQTKTAGGLQVVTFTSSLGSLTVNLPGDIRAGDTISGTVIPEPKGTTEEERNRNSGVLNGYVIQIQGQNFPVNKGNVGPMVIPPERRLTGPGIPPSLDSFFDVFVAVDLTNSPLGRARIPLQPTHPSGAIITPDPKITPPKTPSGGIITIPGTFGSKPHDVDVVPYDIPPLGQTGRPIVITGPFDGDSSNTVLNWTLDVRHGEPTGVHTADTRSFNTAELIAESPRKAVFEVPANVTGPMDIKLKERNVETKGTYRNVGVDLTAPKTSLMKGESTELRVQVNGLEGIKTPVPLTLQCTGVITMEGGIYQPLVIQPSQVSADGRYTTTRGITGVQAGGWGATATVVTGPFNVCLQDDSRAATVILWNSVSGDYSFRSPGGSAAAPTGGAPLTGKGKMVMKGCILTLNHNAPDRRVFASLDTCTNTGNASVESGSPKEKFTITDRNTTDNTCAVQ